MSRIKLKSTRIIVLSATAILLAIVILIFSSLFFLKTTNDSLAEVDNSYNRKQGVILRMTHIVRERSMLMLTMYLEDDIWNMDDQYMKFNRQTLAFIRLRDQLLKLGLTETEQQEFEMILALIRKTEPLQNEIVERIRSGGDKTLRNDISRNDLPLEYKLLDMFNTLSNNTRENAHQMRQRARQAYIHSVFIVTLVSLVIALGITALMYRSLRKIQTIELGLIKETASLGWDATHDHLTNIFNRRWLVHKIGQLNSNEANAYSVNSIIYIDLDDFKPVNDRYGHAAGDSYLIEFCREVEHHIRQNDIFARIGGDEFVILLKNCSLGKAQNIAELILENIRTFTITFEGNNITVNCSIGLLEFKPGDDSLDDMLHKVDALCYEAKRLGKNNIYSNYAL